MASGKGQIPLETAHKNATWLTKDHLAFIDMDDVYFAIHEHKNERHFYNLELSRQNIAELLCDSSWYSLLIPSEEMDLRSFAKVRLWREIAVSLLKKYCDRYYTYKKAEWENKHLEFGIINEDDPNFFKEYILRVEQSRDDIVAKLNELKGIIKSKTIKDIEFGGFRSIMFGQHLYQPLLYVNSDAIEVKPVALNDGERDFVLDLKKFYEGNKPKFKEKELYLLRNRSRGRGIGFFEAGNFYPDFILWLVSEGSQRVNFIDPKGLRNVDGLSDPKIRFSQTIKELETRLGDPSVVLESFIVSGTPFRQIFWWKEGLSIEDFAKLHHILFQVDNKDSYMEQLLAMAGL